MGTFKIAVLNKSKMRPFTKAGFFVALLFCLAITATTTKADPLTFGNVVAVQDGGNTLVDLYANPGVNLVGPQISFRVDIAGLLALNQFDTLRVTYSDAQGAVITQNFDIPLFGTVSPPFTILFTVTSPNATAQGVFATLFVDLLNSTPDFMIPSGPNAGQAVNSHTYSFNVSQPVPEPATILLLGASLLGLTTRFRVKKK